MALADLERRIREYQPNADLSDLKKAYDFSRKAHKGQERHSGEEFINHPLRVAEILADLELDLVTITAALLHDVVEDTDVTLSEIEKHFGEEVVLLVDGVTKLLRLKYKSDMEQQAENLRKMLLAMAKDIRVILIKLADRLHNMRTLDHLPEDKRRRIAEETLDIFAPLAHRLGIHTIKWQLEDLALSYLEPEAYEKLVEMVPKKRREREEETHEVIAILNRTLEEAEVEAEIHGRAKHFYSIHRKLREDHKEIAEIFDLVAVRVIVETVKDCYGVLGSVHTMWKPMPGRFKDYIAMPKSNMYQSLHTTVIGPQGDPVEIQIRTKEMHQTAEYGIAAHWRYKEEEQTDEDFDKKLSWLREILEWQHDLRDAREFMESLKIDLFTDEVFVFTPAGDVLDLPSEATPIDFAYAIHTEVGHECVGAKVNGEIVPLDRPLENGDIVEILTNPQSGGPSSDWLSVVQTSSARSKIRSWFKKQKREENLERGKGLLEREIRRLGGTPEEWMREEWLDEIRDRFGYQSLEELFVSVGYGGVTPGQVVNRLKETREKAMEEAENGEIEMPEGAKRRVESNGDGVRVKGIDNVLVRFSLCCNPVPGDEIIGYITRGRGVSIHRRNCPNITQHKEKEERIIDVSWDGVEASHYRVRIAVNAIDRPKLLADVAQAVAATRTNILSSKTSARRNKIATIDLLLEIRNLDQLNHITKKIEEIRDVVSVTRVQH